MGADSDVTLSTGSNAPKGLHEFYNNMGRPTRQTGCKRHKVTPNPRVFSFTPITELRNIPGQRPVAGFRLSEGPSTSPATDGAAPFSSLTTPELLPEEAKIETVLEADLDRPASNSVTFFYEPLQLLNRSRSMDNSNEATEVKPPVNSGKRPLAPLHTVSLPAAGAIKLSARTYELGHPSVADNRKPGPDPPRLLNFVKFTVASHFCPTDKDILRNSKADPSDARGINWYSTTAKLIQQMQKMADPRPSESRTTKGLERVFDPSSTLSRNNRV